MWLAIDAGNSNLVLGLMGAIRGDAVNKAPLPQKTWRLPTHPLAQASQLHARISALLTAENLELSRLEAIVLGSVVPAVTAKICEAFPQTLVIDHGWRFSYEIATENPAQTGVDRLINAEAVCRERASGTHSIIIDAGTATTICALTAQGKFLGGAILPGIEACRDALVSRTAQLFTVELAPPSSGAIGRNTQDALKSGIVLGYASMISGMIERFRGELATASPELKPRAQVIATGGLSPLLKELCPAPDWISQIDPHLTLKGIGYLYESRRGSLSG